HHDHLARDAHRVELLLLGEDVDLVVEVDSGAHRGRRQLRPLIVEGGNYGRYMGWRKVAIECNLKGERRPTMARCVARCVLAAAAAMLVGFAAQAQTIKIAILGPMAFVQGEHHWYGAEMARDEINKAGGIDVGGKRMRIELVRADTNEIQSVPDATNAVERVITRDKVDFLVGGFR